MGRILYLPVSSDLVAGFSSWLNNVRHAHGTTAVLRMNAANIPRVDPLASESVTRMLSARTGPLKALDWATQTQVCSGGLSVAQ